MIKKRLFTLVLILVLISGTMVSYGDFNGQSSSSHPSAWAVDEINLAVNAGIDIGDLKYQSNITRLEFVRLIYRMICIKNAETRQNDDVDTNENGLSDDAGSGLISNEEAGEEVVLNTDYSISRNGDSAGTAIFEDINDEAVNALYAMSIVNGITKTQFGPYENLTREQGAAILVRVSKYFGFENPNGSPAVFYDGGQMGDWAVQGIKYISAGRTPDGKSIMGGYNNKFNPKGTYTVEEAILSVYRLHEYLSMKPSGDTSWKNKTGCIFSQVILSAAGDCTLGRDLGAAYGTSFDAVYDNSGGDSSLFFKNVSQFFSDDITIVNFEGTLTGSSAAASKTFRFKGRKEYTKVLTNGSINVVNVANNHSHDYLDRGYYDTLNYLSAAGIGYCGYNYTCIKKVNGITYGFYGLAPMGSGLSENVKNSIRDCVSSLKKKGAQYIVGSFHWGVEKSYSPTANQKNIAHYAVDCGTNLVLGHHPHVLQNVERYNGSEILYSLGNFCFGGNKNPSDKDTVVFREKVTFDLETGEITGRERAYYPYRLSSVTNKNDYQPVPVYGNEAERIKKKLWVG